MDHAGICTGALPAAILHWPFMKIGGNHSHRSKRNQLTDPLNPITILCFVDLIYPLW